MGTWICTRNNIQIFSNNTVLLAHPSYLKHAYTDHIEAAYPLHSAISFFEIRLLQIVLLIPLMPIVVLRKFHRLLLYSNPPRKEKKISCYTK